MADPDSMTVSEAAGKMLTGEHADVLREAVRLMLREIMEAEVAELAGGERYERSEEHSSYRNGYRERRFDTRVGSLELAIPGCEAAATSRASSSPVGAQSRRWWRWSSRPKRRRLNAQVERLQRSSASNP